MTFDICTSITYNICWHHYLSKTFCGKTPKHSVWTGSLDLANLPTMPNKQGASTKQSGSLLAVACWLVLARLCPTSCVDVPLHAMELWNVPRKPSWCLYIQRANICHILPRPQCRLIFQSHGWSGFIYIKLHWSIHDHPCIYGTWTEHPNRTHPNHPKTLSEQSRCSTSLIESWVLARLYSLAQAFAPGRNKGQERVVS